jgi:hypothetical protein
MNYQSYIGIGAIILAGLTSTAYSGTNDIKKIGSKLLEKPKKTPITLELSTTNAIASIPARAGSGISIALEDIDGDGDKDLIIVAQDPKNVMEARVYRFYNNGGGNYLMTR